MKKITAFVGSGRKGHTYHAVVQFLDNLKAMGEEFCPFKIDLALAAQAKRYYTRLQGPAYPAPPWVNLFFFRMGRTMMRLETDDSYIDYRYYQERGWFESDYFYPTEMGVVKKAAGKLFDAAFATVARKS